MNIFSDQTGRMTLVPDAGFPMAIVAQGWPGANEMRAAVTSFGIGARSNFQIMHTLRNFVYVYVFGERVSEINVGGIAMATDCANGASGLERLWAYYQDNSVSARGTPISIAIGTRLSFQALLTDFSVNANDPQSGLSQWGMKFLFHPDG